VGGKKCFEIKDNTVKKHSMFIYQESTVVNMQTAQNTANRQEDLLKISALCICKN